MRKRTFTICWIVVVAVATPVAIFDGRVESTVARIVMTLLFPAALVAMSIAEICDGRAGFNVKEGSGVARNEESLQFWTFIIVQISFAGTWVFFATRKWFM